MYKGEGENSPLLTSSRLISLTMLEGVQLQYRWLAGWLVAGGDKHSISGRIQARSRDESRALGFSGVFTSY